VAPENGIIFATSVLLTVGVKVGFRTRTASLQHCCEQADLLSTRISASTAASMNAERASSPVRFPSNAARHAIFALAQPGLSQVLPSSRKKLVRFGHRLYMTKLSGFGCFDDHRFEMDIFHAERTSTVSVVPHISQNSLRPWNS
jgi:hypothetical protein